MQPWWRNNPPTSWTSKCLCPSVRRAASRTRANASKSKSSSGRPFWASPRRWAVTEGNSSSLSAFICGSRALIRAILGHAFLSSRSFFVPISFFRVHSIIGAFSSQAQRTGRRHETIVFREILNNRALAQPPRHLIFENELARILRDSIHPNFVMKVRTGRAAGIADRGDLLAPSDVVPCLDQHLGQVAIAGFDPVAMVDHQHVSVAAFGPGEDHRSVRKAINCFPLLSGNIQPCVHHAVRGIRVKTLSEVRSDPPAGWPGGRDRRQQRFLILEIGGKLLQALLLAGGLRR